MAYVTGVASSLAGLLAAIQNACTSNGWSLAGSVLYKGGCYVELKVSDAYITIRAGTGKDGSNNLTGPCDTATGNLGVLWPGNTFTFPMTYFVHINAAPDEVYAVCNFNTNQYELIAFGVSQMPGLVGTGNWYCGPNNRLSNKNWYRFAALAASGEQNGVCNSLFARGSFDMSCGVHHRLDSSAWQVNGSFYDWASLFYRQPNQWNGETLLLPVRVYAPRPSGFISPVLECAHARFVSIANLADQQIITLGSDRWRVYPFGLRGDTGSQWGGHALRYDGP